MEFRISCERGETALAVAKACIGLVRADPSKEGRRTAHSGNSDKDCSHALGSGMSGSGFVSVPTLDRQFSECQAKSTLW